MNRFSLLALSIFCGVALGASTGEFRVNLLKGTYKQAEYKGATQDEAWDRCVAAIPKTGTGTYTCQTPRYLAVVTPDPPPPIDCAGTWSEWTAGQWSACANGTQSRTETRAFTVTTPPANGGAACPQSPETRTVSQPCSVPVPGMPTADNTGATSGDLRAIGATTISVDGTVLEKFALTGTLNIKANNVTVRNFTIKASSSYGIRVESGTGILIEDGEISGMSSSGIYGGEFTARRLHIHDSGGDAIKPTRNVLIESSYIERLGYLPEAHADGVQMVSGSNVTARGNHFNMTGQPGFKNSQVFMIQTNNSKIDNVQILDNWMNGGGYSIQIRDKGNGYGPPTNVRIERNKIGDDSQFGPWAIDGTAYLCGNVDWQTGALLTGEGNVACP